ncbi:MAG: glycosyltransferase family 39 protein, partial [Pseudomonadota bacterium]|nr:glycosyltransferase family 39 protein [Pseudomonadota bacterium]
PINGREAPFYSVGSYDQSLTFYLRRPVTLVAYRNELDYGLQQARAQEIPEVTQFIRLWSSQATAFAVMEKSMFDDLKRRGVPMRILTATADEVLVARR